MQRLGDFFSPNSTAPNIDPRSAVRPVDQREGQLINVTACLSTGKQIDQRDDRMNDGKTD